MPTLRLSTADQLDIVRRTLAIVEQSGVELETAVRQASDAFDKDLDVENWRIDYDSEYFKMRERIQRIESLLAMVQTEIVTLTEEIPQEWEPQTFSYEDFFTDKKHRVKHNATNLVTDAFEVAITNVLRLCQQMSKRAERHRAKMISIGEW